MFGRSPWFRVIALQSNGPAMPRFVVALLCLALSLTSALAAPPERPEPGEVIDQVAHYTGLTNDAVSLALKDNAAALGRLTDAVLALQIAQRFLDAKNAEIAADVFWTAADTSAEKLLPPPLMTAIKAIRVYKSILEELRDNVLIPALDQKIYEQYRAEREQNQDPVNAFDFAVTMVHGYYVVKPKMVEELIKAKGWNVDVMGERLRRLAEAQVDRFWRERMEATYQQEKAKPQKEAILAAIWASVKDILDQLKAPAAPLSAALFIHPTEHLPPGWWWMRQKDNDFIPKQTTDNEYLTVWSQYFVISNGVGYVHEKDDFWCIPKPHKCGPPWLGVTLDVTLEKPPATEVSIPTSFDRRLVTTGMTRLSRDAGWTQDSEIIHVYFIVGPYLGHVTLRQNPRAGLATFAIAQNYAHVLADKLRAAVPSARAELPF